jgi:hypothetical protein
MRSKIGSGRLDFPKSPAVGGSALALGIADQRSVSAYFSAIVKYINPYEVPQIFINRVPSHAQWMYFY